MTDKLARIENAAKHPAAYGLLDIEAADVLALVSIAKAAQKVEEWHPTSVGWDSPEWHPQHKDAVLALRAALAVLDGDQ